MIYAYPTVLMWPYSSRRVRFLTHPTWCWSSADVHNFTVKENA